MELNVHRRKLSHWAWWAFPTTSRGRSEPLPSSSVCTSTAAELLRRAPDSWRVLLETVTSLAAANPFGINGILPAADVERIRDFMFFWTKVEPRPDWLNAVLATLRSTMIETSRNRRRNKRAERVSSRNGYGKPRRDRGFKDEES